MPIQNKLNGHYSFLGIIFKEMAFKTASLKNHITVSQKPLDQYHILDL